MTDAVIAALIGLGGSGLGAFGGIAVNSKMMSYRLEQLESALNPSRKSKPPSNRGLPRWRSTTKFRTSDSTTSTAALAIWKKGESMTHRLSAWKRLKKWLRGVPHLFAKTTIIYCIICATLASAYALRAQARGMSMEGLLAVVLGFFGGELMLLCLKTILKKDLEGNKNEDPSDEQDV